MERSSNNEFERFLKENADQYRLYPSSKVWNGIYTALHSRRKWFGLGIALLLVTGTFITLLITHSSKEPIIAPNRSAAHKQIPVPDLNTAVPEHHGAISRIKSKDNSVGPIVTDNQLAVARDNFSEENLYHLAGKENDLQHETETSPAPLALNITDELTDQDVISSLQPRKTFEYPKKLTTSNTFDWTIESVLNSFAPLSKRNKRFSLQFNVTPTISYRKLSENKSFLRSSANAPSAFAPLYDINSAVTHKPDMGLEFGVVAKYALASNFKVRAGFQFNINRYDIKAFNYSFEVAKIALRGNTGVDSFYAVSTHRNFSGYKSDWLHNFYFEVSMPVGVEVNLIGDEKVQFGVAGTIQPTYVLGDRAYLLSTDYKNYAEVPWLIRHWNMNAGLETFVSYSTGKMKWQVGPQVRYQLLSSFIDKYPVKENLFDFGLKIGISRNK